MIKLEHVYRSFLMPKTEVLKDINLTVDDGEFICITGKSGSGKSTLLYLMSTLDIPTKGTVFLENQKVHHISKDHLHSIRNKDIGFVFQAYYLLPEFNALQNVLLPTIKAGIYKEKTEEAKELLKNFGLSSEQFDHYPIQLSGGEQQRVAMARALIMKPKYIFADEPTGNLDTVNAKMVMDILRKSNQEMGTTVVYVTHDLDYAAMADRKITLLDGRQV